MTTLIAYHEPNGPIWIGADRQRTQNETVQSLCAVKWLVRDEDWAFACTGSAVVSEIAHRLAGDDALRNDPAALADQVVRKLGEVGWAAECSGGDQPYRGASGTLVSGAKLYRVELGTAFAIEIPPGQVVAEGSGREFALGAWEAQLGVNPKARMDTALRVAIKFDVYSGGEPWIRSIPV